MNNPQEIGKVQLKCPGSNRRENCDMMFNGPILIFTPENKKSQLKWLFLPMFNAEINMQNPKNMLFICNLNGDIRYDVLFDIQSKCSDTYTKYLNIITNFHELLKTIDPHAVVSFSQKVACILKDKKDRQHHEHIAEQITLQKGNKFTFQAHYTENNSIKSFTINFNDESYVGSTINCPKQFGSPNIRHLMFTLTGEDNNEGIFLVRTIQEAYKWVISCFYGSESQKWKPRTPISILSQSVAQNRSDSSQQRPNNQNQTQSPKSPTQTQQNTQNKQPQPVQQPISAPEKQEKPQSQIQPPKQETTVQQPQQQKVQQEQKPESVQEPKESAPKPKIQKPIPEEKPQEPKQPAPVVTTTSEPSTPHVSAQSVPKSEEIQNKTEEHVVEPPKPEPEQHKPVVEQQNQQPVEQKPEIKIDIQPQPQEIKKPEPEVHEPAKETPIPAPQDEKKKEEDISQNNGEKSKPKPQPPSPPTFTITKSDNTTKKEPKKEENQEQIKPKLQMQISITTTVSAAQKAPVTKKVIKRIQKKQETPVIEQKVTEQKRFCTFPHPPPISQRLSSYRTHISDNCNIIRTVDCYQPPNSDIIIKNMKSMEKPAQQQGNLLQNALSDLKLDIRSNYSDFDRCYKLTQNDILNDSLTIIDPSHSDISGFTQFKKYPDFDRNSLINPIPSIDVFLNQLCDFSNSPKYVDQNAPDVNRLCYIVGAIFCNGLKISVQDLSKILSEKYECLKTISYKKKGAKNIILFGAKLLNGDIVIPCLEWIKANDYIIQNYYPSALILADDFDDVFNYLNGFLFVRSFFIPVPEVDSSVEEIEKLLLVPQFLPAEIDQLNKKSSPITTDEAAEVFARCLYLGSNDAWHVIKSLSDKMNINELKSAISNVSRDHILTRDDYKILKSFAEQAVKLRTCAYWFAEIVLAVGSSKENSIREHFTSYSCVNDMYRAFHTICRLNALMKKMGPPGTTD
ncbi:hypothetical protein TVAG_339890 [Trichomonas vaginalis G3]|uniref:Uncharacterized protein n=1 Tax=Trichomonas vaginalis (strain ATCC PRA-98 / G3) TaxID=412133 RepID=A2F170_TRIV3|nr:hypothetical protein TVAGG3_0495240 [Trichomonas vaginalis G3]EAY01361.1 hypothetical protein TVAG_339890 [Trichomonas vaginalis G3]KAI5516667.1 hypothetical protein TVAGG3_0495240 [Trichomonas vaginalis G3]|eukprot:XP_001330214.1 hypothetical protein [Trichomonas vaginalis G3]